MRPVFPNRFFKNELLVVEADANQKDSLYWEQNRAVPLTAEEVTDYKQKDSTEKIQSTDRYKDSIDRRDNRLKVQNIFTGYTYSKTRKELRISLPGLITNGVQYNTVEGLNLSYHFAISKIYPDKKKLTIGGRLRYGFSNKLWGGEAGANYELKPQKFTGVDLVVKSIVEQFNKAGPISPLLNSVYTLLLNENHIKLYKETGIAGGYHSEIVNGVFLTSRLSYMQRDPLNNTTDLLLIDDKHKLFTSNEPQLASHASSLFSASSALTAEITLAFRFMQKYYTLPHEKIITGSKYPRLEISYKRAIPVLNATADFDLLSASVSDLVKLGIFGNLGYRLRGGAFLTTNTMYFADYKHFSGNQTIYANNNYLNSFRLLPYYFYSSNRWFSEAHAEHHFHGLILDKLPVIKKLKMQEVAGIHVLSNNNLRYYYEINFGLEKIFKILRLDYVLAYSSENRLQHGFTFSLNFSF
jgi:hypothetical protein